jgi:hypothetical protein
MTSPLALPFYFSIFLRAYLNPIIHFHFLAMLNFPNKVKDKLGIFKVILSLQNPTKVKNYRTFKKVD